MLRDVLSTVAARPERPGARFPPVPARPMGRSEMIPLKNAVPSRYPPVVTWILIATNCLVFLFQNSLSPLELEMFLRDFALIPARYTAGLAYGELTLGAFVPMFTMMFLMAAGCTSSSICGRSGCSARPWRIGWGTAAILSSISPAALRPRLRISSSIRRRLFRRSAPLARLPACSDATCDSFRSRGSSCSFPILFIPLFFEVHRLCLCRALVRDSDFSGNPRARAAVEPGGRRVVGPCRRLRRGICAWPPIGYSPRSATAKYYADEGILGFDTAGRV